MNIVLIGYRGTGKSTVARLLGAKLELLAIDADEELERRAGKTIREIFADGGEPLFRDLEAEVLAELCGRAGQVLAVGGGAVLRPENRSRLRSAGNRVIWLQGDAATLYRRIAGDATTSERRPNLTAVGGLEEVERLLAIRERLYRECAEFIVDTEAKTPEQVASEIASLLRS